MSGRIFLLFCVFIGVQTIPAPKLTLCKEKDSDCLTKTANVIYKLAIPGVPELNIQNLDPFYQDVIRGDLTGINYKLFNSTVEGAKNCDVVNTKLDLQKSKLILDMTCPLLTMNGVYVVSGKILSVPIAGNGDYRIKCKDYSIQIDTNTKISQRKDGKKYISFNSFKINSELKGGMVVDVTNLFDGKQKELGIVSIERRFGHIKENRLIEISCLLDPIFEKVLPPSHDELCLAVRVYLAPLRICSESVLQFINKNWKPVVTVVQAPVFNTNVKELVKNFNKYLKSVPLEKILLDF